MFAKSVCLCYITLFYLRQHMTLFVYLALCCLLVEPALLCVALQLTLHRKGIHVLCDKQRSYVGILLLNLSVSETTLPVSLACHYFICII